MALHQRVARASTSTGLCVASTTKLTTTSVISTVSKCSFLLFLLFFLDSLCISMAVRQQEHTCCLGFHSHPVLPVGRKVEKAHDGPCQGVPQVCVCQPIYLPVCGSDGRTYSNLCELKCQ